MGRVTAALSALALVGGVVIGVISAPPPAVARVALPNAAASPIARCELVGSEFGDVEASYTSHPFVSFAAGRKAMPPGFPTVGGTCFRDYQHRLEFYYFSDAVEAYRQLARNLPARGWNFARDIGGGASDYNPTLREAQQLTVAQISDSLVVDDWSWHNTPHPGSADLYEYLSNTGSPQPMLLLMLNDGWHRTAAPSRPTSASPSAFNRKSFISSLKSIGNAIPSAKQAGAAAGGVVVLSLVIGYPAFLLNKVIEGRFESWRDWVRRRWKRLEPQRKRVAGALKLRPRKQSRWSLPRWALWPAFTVAGILGSIDDPDFGFTLTTLRTIITLTLSIAIFNFAAWTLTRRVLRRYEPNVRADIDVKLASIGILLVSVIISRLLDFSPGVVFGTVAGLVYAIELGLSRKVIVILTGTAFSAAIAIVAWVAYTLFGLIPGASTNGWLIGVTEVFGGITIAGVSAAPLALLPLGNLDGAALFKWRRLVWAASYVVVLFLFVVTMFDLPQSFTAVSGDVIRWLILFGAFAVIAVAAWLVDAELTRRRASRDEAHPAVPAKART